MRLAGYGHESNYSLYEADNNLQHGGQLSMIGGRVERNYQYPLWMPHEVRIEVGGKMLSKSDGSPTGYHFHNFFMSGDQVRHKYATYGHADDNVIGQRLGSRGDDADMQLALACARGEESDDNREGSFESISSSVKPIYYLNEAVRRERHDKWQHIVWDDDERFNKKDIIQSLDIVEDTVPVPASKINSHWQSSKSAVLGLASGYGLETYNTFVGSLRATGYSGHIILAIAKDAPSDVVSYLNEQNVTIKYVERAEKCTYNGTIGEKGVPIDMQKSYEWNCPQNYPEYKITWARFLFYRDWLHDCPSCTDGVILTDVRDAFFQKDPFVTAVKNNQEHSLMVFQEHPDLTTEHWLTDWPVTSCRDFKLGKNPMLCSGSVMGSRDGILKYIDVMEKEFKYWMKRENCRNDNRGDDQSIHNYLYYAGRLKHAVSIPHRQGPIHVVGYEAAEISGSGNVTKVDDDHWKEWMPQRYGLTNRYGQIVNLDGTPSAQVHQVDRFNDLISAWQNRMEEQGWATDIIQSSIPPPPPRSITSPSYNFLRPSDFKPLKNLKTNNILYADAKGSAKRLLKEAQTPRSIPDHIIDPVTEEARCKRYNLNYSGRKKRRRVFYGSNIADDSWHILSTHALEFYGIFHTVVFSESNRTHHHYPRALRFEEEESESLRLLQNNIYGPKTKVHVEQYTNEKLDFIDLDWEAQQAKLITQRWKENGMSNDDIGYLSDVDEIYTRDYIRAMQICDVKEFDAHENCRDARISGHALV